MNTELLELSAAMIEAGKCWDGPNERGSMQGDTASVCELKAAHMCPAQRAVCHVSE